jgi:deoxyribodipyrimidine photo-lyase
LAQEGKLNMETSTAIVWFRQDLRLEDNQALTTALKHHKHVIPVYIWTPEEEGSWPLGTAAKWWLHHSLENLDQELKKRGSRLIIREGSTLKALNTLIKELKASTVYWNRRYEPSSIKRDAAIVSELQSRGIQTETFNANLLFEPWSITNKQGLPYKVFTHFWKTCCSQDEPLTPLTTPIQLPVVAKEISSVTLDLMPLFSQTYQDYWEPGTAAAHKRLSAFIKEEIDQYVEKRDRPDYDGVSRLSPYLHFGEISPRTIWHAIKKNCRFLEKGPKCYLKQLGWREFAHHLLYHFPFTPEKALRSEFNHFPWVFNSAYLKAWQQGKTGYPLVDAGMRQLLATGWMHNRVRMVVGSFLVKDLLISWTEGAKFFWETLVDADLANNTLGWQWVGGCGADAAPYFRVFNPVTQSEKFDPEGTYIRKWIPELAKVPNQWIHKPWEAPDNFGYPLPIVDHKAARELALKAFDHVRT